MEHLYVNKNIRLETVKLSMATVIFSTIERDREYLQMWLPFIEMTQNISDTEKFIQRVVNQPAVKKDDIYSIWHNEEFAGLIGFKDTDWINRKTELGYWLAENKQGKGIATMCVNKLIRYTFQKLKMNRIQIKVAVGNAKSAAIPQHLGFVFEGIERAGELNNEKYHDLEIYSLLKTDAQ